MIQNSAFVEGDLLYHSIHGLCRLDKVSSRNDAGKNGRFYSLIPHTFKRGNLRFNFSAEDMESTGFHALVTVTEAYAILLYFKKGLMELPPDAPKLARSFSDDNQTWALARFLLSCALDQFEAKDQRKRQALKRAARGLILELSHVLQLPLTETIFQVRKNLESTNKLHPLVLAALNDAGQE